MMLYKLISYLVTYNHKLKSCIVLVSFCSHIKTWNDRYWHVLAREKKWEREREWDQDWKRMVTRWQLDPLWRRERDSEREGTLGTRESSTLALWERWCERVGNNGVSVVWERGTDVYKRGIYERFQINKWGFYPRTFLIKTKNTIKRGLNQNKFSSILNWSNRDQIKPTQPRWWAYPNNAATPQLHSIEFSKTY